MVRKSNQLIGSLYVLRIIYKVLYISGGARCLPSTVSKGKSFERTSYICINGGEFHDDLNPMGSKE